MAPSCPSCGKTIFNKRYPKCEFCGAALPEGLALTTEQRNAIITKERDEADRAWLAARSARPSQRSSADTSLFGLFGGDAGTDSGASCDGAGASGGDGSC